MDILFKNLLPPEEKGEEGSAAVLIPILRGKKGYKVVYTRRSFSLRDHPGEICFPGGRFDPEQDKTLLDTALRESMEELGIDKDKVEVKGRLPAVKTFTSNFRIVPFVGVIERPFRFKVNREEVMELVEVPLDYICNPESIREGFTYMNGRFVLVYVIPYKRHIIWGATALITKSLSERISIVQ